MRSLKELFSPIGLSHLLLIKPIFQELKNPWSFLYHYILHDEVGGPYELKSGGKILCKDFDDLGTLSEVAFKKCYGSTFPPEGVIIDIGGNTGIPTIYMASHSTNAVFYVYEPFSDNYNVIEQQAKFNDLENRIFVMPMGVDGNQGMKKLYITEQSVTPNLYNLTHSNEFIEIKTTTLNDIIKDNNLEKIELIKMDCEGSEFDILYNTSNKNLAKIKEIRFEYHDVFGDDPQRNSKYLKQWLIEKGFIITKVRTQPHAINCGFIRCTNSQ